MKSPSPFQTKRSWFSYAKFRVNRKARFVLMILSLAAVFSLTFTLLTFAQKRKPEKLIQAEPNTQRASEVERPRRSAPERKEAGRGKRTRNGDQDQDLASQSQQEKGQKDRGERKPKMSRMKRGREFQGDLRQLPQGSISMMERPELEGPEPSPSFYVAPGQSSPVEDGGKAPQAPAAGPAAGPAVAAPAPPPSSSFEGLSFGANGNGHPPDTNGDVGPQYYIQSINTSIGIYDKTTGNLITAPNFNTFMSQGHFGNLCDTNNFGDPVVLYDTFEDRWVITDFAFTLNGSGAVINPPGAFQCVAVSRSGDPVSGGWNFYSVNTAGGLGDYPKFGIWPDGVYMSANVFNFAGTPFLNPRAYAFNKAQMYAGAASVQIVSFDAPAADFTILPSNARLQTGTPPPGTPNYYLSTWEFLNGVTVYKFHVDWNNPAASSFTGPDVPIAATSWPNASVPNAPSQGGNSLDVLQIRAMMQNQYTNLGGAESLWATHTVRRANNSTDVTGFAAPRYYQVPVNGGTVGPNITQAATFDPDGANVIHRFMPSLAVDRAGNMALGYSTSSTTSKPAIKYAGRLSTDPINTFSQTEQVLIQGAGTQTGNCGTSACTRWGDYSAMTLDPDGCTFWYTNMYYPVDGLNHHTRIGSFTLPQCTTVGVGSIQGTVTSSSGGGPIQGATVTLGSRTATTDASGFYSFANLAAGTYPSIVASYPGYTTVTVNSLAVNTGSITNQNFVLGPDLACLTDTSQADFKAGTTVNADLNTSPGDVVLASLSEQNTNIGTSGFGFSNAAWVAQTFQPQSTGQLAQVDLAMFCAGCSGVNPNVIVSIRNTTLDVPSGVDLATATIPGFSSGSIAYYPAVFSSPPTLTAGTRYAIVFRLAAARVTGTQAYATSAVSAYINGRRATSANSGGTWTGDSTRDLGFVTHMITAYAPSGTFASSPKDANPSPGGSIVWTTLSWNAATPAGTQVKFQVAGSNSILGPFNFVGPDTTAGTFFTASGASLAQFNGLRYLKYQATLTTTSGTVTPALNDVTICRGNTVVSALTVGSATGTYGGTVNLSARLTDGVSPLSGRTINFTLNGNSAGSGVTDGSGIAIVNSASLAGINANTYPAGVGASFGGDATYLARSATNTLTVNRADAVIVVTPYSVQYDGNPHTATGTTTGVNSESLSGLNLSGTTHTDAGNYTGDPWTFTDVTGNYNNSSGTVDDAISQAPSSTTVTVSNAVYDGNPHGGTASATGVGGLNQSVTVSYSGRNSTVYGPSTTAPTDAGDYTASANFLGDTNHTGSSDARDYSITQASSVTTVTVSNAVFDGNPHGGNASVTGVGGLNQSLTVSYSGRNSTVYGPSNTPPTNAGDYTASASFAGDANHSSSSDSKDFSISQTGSVTTVTVSNAIYDGNPHGGSAVVTGAGGLNQSLTVTYTGRNSTIYGPSTTPPTNAGDYTASANFAGDADHTGSSDSKDFSIAKNSSATTVTVANAVYDGNPHGGTATANGAGGLNQALVVTYTGRNTTVYGPSTTPPTNAGDYTASANFAGDGNHTGSSDSKDYSIAQAGSATTVTCPASVVFTGLPLTPCTAVATGAGGLNVSLAVSYANNLNPGIASANASYPGDANHTGSAGAATFVITAPAYNFVIGDNNAIVGNQVTFWGAQWAKQNSLSGGGAPSSFKGFANSTGTAPAICGGTWTSSPGNSSGPPASVPEYITVIVSSSINKSGSVISGNNYKLVIVKTNPGYGPDPGQAGTGTVYSIVCQ